MIRVSVFYPAGDGRTFNMDYYLKTHIPLFKKCMGAAMKEVRVERGVGGATPGTPAIYVAIAHATFDSAEAFGAALAPHAAEIMGDVPNYTNIQPVIQISEVLM